MQIINPATGAVIQSVKEESRTQIVKKENILRNGQKKWAAISLKKRVSILQKFAKLLTTNIESLAASLTEEVGKPLAQSRNEINGAVSRITWLTAHAEQYLSRETMTSTSGLKEEIVYEPLGVIANISAWNYPYLVGVNVIVPALLAGNAVLYKPSEFATLTGLNITRLLHQAGVPEDAFQSAIGAKEVGECLLDLPLDGYFFTGSYVTGQYIYQRVAPKLVPCQLELGGKDPIYIAQDVKNIQQVAAATADGAFYNAGQSCCSVERIYVHERVYEHFVAEFVKEVKSYTIGLPTAPNVYIGPLTRSAQIAVLEAQVKDALRKGATLLTGGKRIAGVGNYFEPTVVSNVTPQMKVMREESFGPIIGIMKVKDDAEAIALMNDSNYGLTAGVYTPSRKRADAILSQMNTGSVYWNCCDRVSAALPWSGRGHSGIGATLSHAGLRAFTRPKAYHLKG